MFFEAAYVLGSDTVSYRLPELETTPICQKANIELVIDALYSYADTSLFESSINFDSQNW